MPPSFSAHGDSYLACTCTRSCSCAVRSPSIRAPPPPPLLQGTGKISKIILEIHYDNPALEAGFVDSMGFEAFYVNTPRPHDAGMLIVGDPLVAVRRPTAMCVWTYVRARHVHTCMRVGRDGGSCSA